MKKPLTIAYLTRQDIAAELQISPKQAGRLMERMPTILIGVRQKRVARADFDQWIAQQKKMPAPSVKETAAAYRNRRSGMCSPSSQSTGSVRARAEIMRIMRDKR